MSDDQDMWVGRTRIHHRIARDLAEAILAGRYAPGAMLPGEVEGSTDLGVSRTAYREAMRILTAKGLIESRPRAGSRVCAKARWNILDPEMLAWMFAGEPSEAFLRDLFELRAMIEPAAAALAAERRSDQDLATMDRALADMARWTLAHESGRAADRLFHHALLSATGNDALVALSSSIGAAVAWTTSFKQRHRALPRDPLPDHTRVRDAIAAGNAADARAAMTELVLLALDDMGIERPG